MRTGRGETSPNGGASRRAQLGLRGELLLALLPTLTVLGVLWLLEVLNRQQILFASLASSAFLVYLDPHHEVNTVRTLVASHAVAVAMGLLAVLAVGHGYAAAAVAMVGTILAIVLLDIVHPPAVSTALTFAFRVGAERDVLPFALALALTAALVLAQQAAVRLLGRGRAGGG